jgi:signal recognition particle subunit SRP19
MRKKDRVILWPIYFDSTKTRSEGRRVTKKLAVSTVNLKDILGAAESLNLSSEIVSDASHPKLPNKKTGLITILKKEPKNEIIQKIAKVILEKRKKL